MTVLKRTSVSVEEGANQSEDAEIHVWLDSGQLRGGETDVSTDRLHRQLSRAGVSVLERQLREQEGDHESREEQLPAIVAE